MLSPTKRFRTREEKLDVLIAKDEIRDVLMRYARGIGRCDPDLVAACYHPGAEDEHGAFSGSASDFAVEAMKLSRVLCETNHSNLTNAIIDVDGDTARCESYYLGAKVLTERDADGAIQIRLSGVRNLDEFEKRDGEWRIMRRQLIGEWGMNLPFGGQPSFPPNATPPQRGTRDMDDPSYEFWKGASIYV